MTFEKIEERQDVRVIGHRWSRLLSQPVERAAKAPRGTQSTQGAIPRDPEQPRFDALHRPEARTRSQRVMERVLQEVFGKRPISDHLNEIPAEALLATSKRRFETHKIIVRPRPPT